MAQIINELWLIGCGNMGQAVLSNIVSNPSVSNIKVIDRDIGRLQQEDIVVSNDKINLFEEIEHLDNEQAEASDPDIVILALKPQQFGIFRDYFDKERFANTIFISIAAGLTISQINDLLFEHAKIVRAMPNTPISVGAGVMALCANDSVSDMEKEILNNLFDNIGTLLWQDEDRFDIITALSGSGPAYIFYLLEVLTQQACDNGMNKEEAYILSLATVDGAVQLAKQSANLPPEELRKRVTSKAGTTEAALNLLMDSEHGLAKIFSDAISAAVTRSRELSSQIEL